MQAVLIAHDIEGDNEGDGLEIAIEIENIPPIDFEYNFYIPHRGNEVGRLALKVLGWSQDMARNRFKVFRGEPIRIYVEPNHNSEEGLDYKTLKRCLDRRLV